MMNGMERISIDHDWLRRSLAGTCFICEYVAGNPEHFHHMVYEDDETVAFLNKYPTVHEYVIVAPKQHKEKVTGDFTEREYIQLQRVIHRVGEAIRRTVPTERLYVLSLGSQQGNRHVHWHLAPLPPGTPYEAQQYRALNRNDYLQLSSGEAEQLAQQIQETIGARKEQ